MFKKLFMALAACAAFSAGSANAESVASVNHRAAPVAFELFCLKNPGECRKSGRPVIAHTPKIAALLVRVNSSVNRSITPRREREDRWTLNPAAGDCDDYVMTKRHRLIRAGVPASALRVAVVQTRSGEGHAVLVVKTTAGDLVLDNLRKTIVPRSKTGYRLVSMSSANPTVWN